MPFDENFLTVATKAPYSGFTPRLQRSRTSRSSCKSMSSQRLCQLPRMTGTNAFRSIRRQPNVQSVDMSGLRGRNNLAMTYQELARYSYIFVVGKRSETFV